MVSNASLKSPPSFVRQAHSVPLFTHARKFQIRTMHMQRKTTHKYATADIPALCGKENPGEPECTGAGGVMPGSTREEIQSYTSGADTFVYPPGKSPQPMPKLTMPTCLSVVLSNRGPPESPWQESLPGKKAHIMVCGSKPGYVLRHCWSLYTANRTSLNRSLTGPSKDVVPQPIVNTEVPGKRSTLRRGNGTNARSVTGVLSRSTIAS